MSIQSNVVDGVRTISITYPTNEAPPKEIRALVAELLVALGTQRKASRGMIRLSLKKHNIPDGYWRWAMEPWAFPEREPDLTQYPIHCPNYPIDPPYHGH